MEDLCTFQWKVTKTLPIRLTSVYDCIKLAYEGSKFYRKHHAEIARYYIDNYTEFAWHDLPEEIQNQLGGFFVRTCEEYDKEQEKICRKKVMD